MENFLVCLPAASGSAEADPADPPAATDNQLPSHGHGTDTAAAGASGEPVTGCSAAPDVQQRIFANPWPHLDIFLSLSQRILSKELWLSNVCSASPKLWLSRDTSPA